MALSMFVGTYLSIGTIIVMLRVAFNEKFGDSRLINELRRINRERGFLPTMFGITVVILFWPAVEGSRIRNLIHDLKNKKGRS